MTRKGRFVPRTALFDIWPDQAIGPSRRNRLVRIIDNAGSPDSPRGVLASQYDPAGNRESLAATLYNGSTAEPDFINNYSYDALSRLTVMQQQQQNQPGANAVAAKEIDYAYNGLGEVTSRADFNFIGVGPRQDMATGNFTYDSTTGLLTSLNYTSHGGATAIDNFNWTYDTLARVKTFSSIDGTATYGYDSRSEVTSAGYTTAAGGHQPANGSFSFDANGNRPVANGGTITNNEVSDDGTFKYTFDADGNRLTRTRDSAAAANDYQVSYSCDYRNRLVEARDFNNSGTLTEQIDYTYDVFDHLIQRVDDVVGGATTTTQYIWDNLFPLPPGEGQGEGGIVLSFTNGALSARNLNGPNTNAADQYFTTLAEEHITSLVTPGILTFDLSDNEGTLRDVADTNGNPADHLVYTVFGQLAYESAPTVSHLDGYAGGLYDPSTQLVYFIHRWYDPKATVWMSADPSGFAAGDTNLTRYVGNSPSNRIDANGLEWLTCYGNWFNNNFGSGWSNFVGAGFRDALGDEYLVNASDCELLAVTTISATAGVAGGIAGGAGAAAAGITGYGGAAIAGAAGGLAEYGGLTVGGLAVSGGTSNAPTVGGALSSAAGGAVGGVAGHGIGNGLGAAGKRLFGGNGKIPLNAPSSSPPTPKTIVVDPTRYPESACHLKDAGATGRVLTVNRQGAAKNRTDALRGRPKISGRDLDEAPPAVLRQPGDPVSVRPISPADNRGAGASMGNQMRDVPDGGPVIIQVPEPGGPQ